MKTIENNKKPRDKKKIFKKSLFGITRTALLMGSLLFFLQNQIILGGIGIVFYGVVLFIERKYKKENRV